jgi:hypothetical protein
MDFLGLACRQRPGGCHVGLAEARRMIEQQQLLVLYMYAAAAAHSSTPAAGSSSSSRIQSNEGASARFGGSSLPSPGYFCQRRQR